MKNTFSHPAADEAGEFTCTIHHVFTAYFYSQCSNLKIKIIICTLSYKIIYKFGIIV